MIHIYPLVSLISFVFTEILPLVEKTACIRIIDYTFYHAHHPRMKFCGKALALLKLNVTVIEWKSDSV